MPTPRARDAKTANVRHDQEQDHTSHDARHKARAEKLGPAAVKGVFVGYSERSPGSCTVYIEKTNQVMVRRSVLFTPPSTAPPTGGM